MKKIGHKALPGKAGLAGGRAHLKLVPCSPSSFQEQRSHGAGADRHSPDRLEHTSVTPEIQRDTAFIQISSPVSSFFWNLRCGHTSSISCATCLWQKTVTDMEWYQTCVHNSFEAETGLYGCMALKYLELKNLYKLPNAFPPWLATTRKRLRFCKASLNLSVLTELIRDKNTSFSTVVKHIHKTGSTVLWEQGFGIPSSALPSIL